MQRLSIQFIAVLATLICAAAVSAADGMLTADTEVLFPAPPAVRAGGVAAYGGSQIEVVRAENQPPLIRISGKSSPLRGAWWFANHQPMKPEQAMIGDPQARLTIEASSASSVRTELSAQWRVEGTAGETVISPTLAFEPGKWTTIELPVPAIEKDARITGLILSFGKGGEYQVRKLALGRLSASLLEPIAPEALRLQSDISISGRAAAGAQSVNLSFTPKDETEPALQKQVPVNAGLFQMTLKSEDLKPGVTYLVTSQVPGKGGVSPAQRVFAYPQMTGRKCPPVTREGWHLMREGRPFGFVGVNYTRFDLGLSITADFEGIARDVLLMKSWGIRVVRIPLHVGFIQPAPGVFPDSPQHAELYKKHNLDRRFMEQLDYFVALAGEAGIYSVIDWHDYPTDPYRYFVGGQPSDREKGKPGNGIAYLAPSSTERIDFDLSNPVHLKTLCDTHRWMAAHFRGDPNIMGFEIPHNEPHTKYMAIEANWRRITDATAKAVHEGDPDRLTFTLGPSYSHNNLLPSVTWLAPDRAAGAGPHFYQANGPVPVRPDAKSFDAPWLARENEGTFGWAFPAMILPLSAADYPFYNGEGGMHGHQSLLPQIENVEAASLLMEAQLVQAYATGMIGHLEWTLWDNPGDFKPYLAVYEKMFRRFAPVYETAPIDRRQAQVAFVQNPEAAPSSNGYNHACVPLAKAALDLQLGIVHYLTDDQLRYIGAAELSVGLEQVVETAEDLHYKALVVDRRNLDSRVPKMLERMKVPVLWLDDAEKLTADQLAEFLTDAGIAVDTKTPRQIQLVKGPKHLIAYRRLDGGANPARVYPQLAMTGQFELVGESGQSAFKGTAADLAQKGIEVDLPLWRSAIYEIRQ